MIDRKQERTQRFNRKKKNKKLKPATLKKRMKESLREEEHYTYFELKNLGE